MYRVLVQRCAGGECGVTEGQHERRGEGQGWHEGVYNRQRCQRGTGLVKCLASVNRIFIYLTIVSKVAFTDWLKNRDLKGTSDRLGMTANGFHRMVLW